VAGYPPAAYRPDARGQRDKPEKKWFVENRWLPAVNFVAARHGWDTRDFLEIAGPAQIADIERLILAKIQRGHHPTPVPPLVR
jgi:hypothetical protein